MKLGHKLASLSETKRMVYVTRFQPYHFGTRCKKERTPPLNTLRGRSFASHKSQAIARHVPLSVLRGAILDHLVCVVAEARSGVVGSDLPLQHDLGLLLVVSD